VTYPETYPNLSSAFFVYSEELEVWAQDLNDFADSGSKTAVELFSKMIDLVNELEIDADLNADSDDAPQFLDDEEFVEEIGGTDTGANEWGEEKKKS